MLERDPRRRMGVTRGATEIKRHPFFASVDLALIRCMAPPVVPDRDAVAPAGSGDRKAAKLGSWSSMSSNCGSKKRKSSSSNFRRRSTSTCEERQGVFRMLVSWNQESWFSNKIKTTTSKER
jgi:protein-serine/threonine kinase